MTLTRESDHQRGLRSVVGELIEHVRHYDIPDEPSYAAFVDAWADRIHAASGVPRMQQQIAEDRKAQAAVRAEQAAEALLAARLGAADPRGYIGYRLGGEQGQTAHDWDYNYQCLRCGRFEHDPGIGEPCTGTGHPMVICCAEHSAELAAAAVADYRSSRRETDR